jgi:hypothetical protein
MHHSKVNTMKTKYSTKENKTLQFGHYHENVEVKYYKREELFSFFIFQFCNVIHVVNNDRYKTTTQPNLAHIYIYESNDILYCWLPIGT